MSDELSIDERHSYQWKGTICVRLVKIAGEEQEGWFTEEENSSFLRNERSQWWMQLWSETEKSWRVSREAPMAMSYQQHWEGDTEANRQNATQSHNSTNCRGASSAPSGHRKGSIGGDTSTAMFLCMVRCLCLFLSFFRVLTKQEQTMKVCIGFMQEYCWLEYARNKFKFVFYLYKMVNEINTCAFLE